ncbi:MAG: cation transporter [Gammaproteobacteria bacterium]|nr:cation transporter [Gammaproteobacteria bacterium]
MMMILNITGMSCGHCTAAVEKALLAVAGVESVTVDLETNSATVDGSAAVDVLIAAVVEEGYEAVVA